MAFNLGQILGSAGSAGAVGFDQSYDAVRRRHLEDLELQGQNILAGALMPGAQPMPGPIGGIGPLGARGPQPPPPGQQSMPMRPPPQQPPGPPQGAPGNEGGAFGGMPGWAPGERPIGMGAPPIQPSPQGPPPGPGGGAPPPGGGAPPSGAGQPQPGMPQLDLPVLLQRIQERYPGAPPAAVMSAVQRAIPLLSMEGKREALLMRQQYLHESLAERGAHNSEMEARNRALDELRDRLAQQREQGLNTRLGTREAGQNERLDTREAGRNARVSPDVAAFQTYMEQNPNATAEDMAKFRGTLRAQGGAAGAPAGRTPTGVAVAKFMQENPNATSDQIMDFAHAHDKQSATSIRYNEKAKGYDNAHQIIEDALGDIKKSYQGGISVTGLAGRGLRIGEIASNIAGWSDSTLANSFQQKVELLKTTLPRLLTGASITNKDERARMDKIVAGLSAGDTRQITVDDMLYLQKVLKNLRPSDYDKQGRATGGAAAPAAAPGFDRAAAKAAGYTDEQIDAFLKKKQ